MEAEGSLGEVVRERHGAGASFEGHELVEKALLELVGHADRNLRQRSLLSLETEK